ncbi:hypothetical protein MNV49_002336 [Pseudohyphozyma bogoriensis]|nr:hypothetical protein MNV49_002336 [Pseudohyphozyma bogoriensis]
MATKAKQSTLFPNAEGGIPQLRDVAELIKDGKVKNVVVMAGAGISTAAGIPDFRSPETGLYHNLSKYNLPYPEAIFDIDYFKRKPQAFFALAKELYPGNFTPTKTHYFFKLLKDKGVLRTVFTQNIDTLERLAGLTDADVVEAHGSFASAECLRCKTTYSTTAIKPQIDRGEVVRCERPGCKGKKDALVKFRITFFGEQLPKRLFQRLPDLDKADLLIVLGTSLTAVKPKALILMEGLGEKVE